MHNYEPVSSLFSVSEPAWFDIANFSFQARRVHVGNLSPNMGSRFSTVGEHHGTSHGQDDTALGFPAHHAPVSFGGLCEGILFDHRAHTRHFRKQ